MSRETLLQYFDNKNGLLREETYTMYIEDLSPSYMDGDFPQCKMSKQGNIVFNLSNH